MAAEEKGEPRGGSATRLLRWFEENHRQLPWREVGGGRQDPYLVLVSETMLQQTQVEVVIPKYREFIARFGCVEALALAGQEEVRAAWTGLGYYRRAERLHQASRTIYRSGAFPNTAKKLLGLPGIGEYTAAAVASIAFGEEVPVVDGNVERVVSRWRMIAGNPKHRKIRAKLCEGAAALLVPSRAGDSNQALMELGATVCSKARPACDSCPISDGCRARTEGRTDDFPSRVRSEPRRQETWRQEVVLRRGQGPSVELLLERRSDLRAVLAKAWLLPDWREAGESLEVGSFKHSITTTDYRVVLLQGGHSTGAVEDGRRFRWVPLDGFDHHGRWQLSEPLVTSSMLAKAVGAIRDAMGSLQLLVAPGNAATGKQKPSD